MWLFINPRSHSQPFRNSADTACVHLLAPPEPSTNLNRPAGEPGPSCWFTGWRLTTARRCCTLARTSGSAPRQSENCILCVAGKGSKGTQYLGIGSINAFLRNDLLDKLKQHRVAMGQVAVGEKWLRHMNGLRGRRSKLPYNRTSTMQDTGSPDRGKQTRWTSVSNANV